MSLSSLQICMERLSSHFRKKNVSILQLWTTAESQENFQKYIADVTMLTWSMVWQTPQLKFRASDSYLGQQYQSLCENSVRPAETENVDMIQVLPMMYEDDKLLIKGLVAYVQGQHVENMSC